MGGWRFSRAGSDDPRRPAASAPRGSPSTDDTLPCASYARFSSALQKEESITDQQRRCRDAAELAAGGLADGLARALGVLGAAPLGAAPGLTDPPQLAVVVRGALGAGGARRKAEGRE